MTAPAMDRATIAPELAAYDVRPSNVVPGKFVICHTGSGRALEHPAARIEKTPSRRWAMAKEAYFKTAAEAWEALPGWLERAEELSGTPRPPLRGLAVSRVVTLAEELDAMRAEQAKRDKDPYYKWHPCTGAHCMCKPAPTAFRSPSKELLAMQAGKKAY